MKCTTTILLLLATSSAYATTLPPTVPTPTTSGPSAESSATSTSNTSLGQSQNALAEQQQSQSAFQTQASNVATTSTQGNAQSITYARQAPSVAQGSLYGSQCVSGGNAGGSNTGGSAFLGVQFTSYECHLARLAASWADAGDHKTACEILRRSPAMKRLKRETGFEPPPCVQKPAEIVHVAHDVSTPPVNVNVTLPDMSAYALKTEVAESQKRQTERMVGK